MISRTGVTWATESGAAVGDVLHAWQSDRTVSVPVGRLWHVVRVTRRVGVPTLQRLRTAGVGLGPVLETMPRETIEWLVPAGTARTWPPIPGTACTDTGNWLCPAPWVTACAGSSGVNGRRWIVSPTATVLTITDADALCEAVAAAVCHLAEPYIPGYQPTRQVAR